MNTLDNFLYEVDLEPAICSVIVLFFFSSLKLRMFLVDALIFFLASGK